jgi:hypothetical protein|tara:strand:+ start:445 stop:621 length:177 start_codon:yes stop_codon:yes gene_type:complete
MNKLVKIILTEEEKKLLKELRDSITPDTIEEWGRNEMRSHVEDDYAAHPDAKGYKDTK